MFVGIREARLPCPVSGIRSRTDSLSELELFRYRYQYRKYLQYCLKCSIGYQRVRTSKYMCQSDTITWLAHLLHRQRTSQTLLCYAAFVNGRRWEVGFGNASSPTYVRMTWTFPSWAPPLTSLGQSQRSKLRATLPLPITLLSRPPCPQYISSIVILQELHKRITY